MNDILRKLNPPQAEAVTTTEGPLLILAGAGSGKTRVLTHRIAWLIREKQVSPWNILAITFTNKAAQEMRERVDGLVGTGAESIWVSTFHSACVRILRRHIDFLNYDTHFVIYDADDQKNIMKDICRRLEIDTKLFKEKMLLAEISHAKERLLTPDDVLKEAVGDFHIRKVADVYREYEKTLRSSNALDFDDLIVKTTELFEKHPQVLEYYQERFRYIHVDEYQDTNYAQFRLVELLSGKYRNLCVVGDDDQSIYRFRGADIRNILDFEKAFPDAAVIRLEQNYRSTGNILDAANHVIENNSERKKKTLWTENETGEKIHFRQFMNGFEEAEYVVGEITRSHSRGLCAYKDCAVLYRTNAQSRVFEEKLLLANIPYKIVGGINFYARKEIKDLLSYLKVIDNARDDLSTRRILNVPRRGIGDTTQKKVQLYADHMECSFYDALRVAEEIPSLGRGLSKITQFVTLIQTLKAKAEHETVRELLEDVLVLTGYEEELRREGTDEAEARLENIAELISKAQIFDENEEKREEKSGLSGFLEEIALIADIDTVNPDQDYVLLMTLHSAKGLEFPRVYITGMEEGLFPGYMADEDESELQEERRLCYVGITRAMKELTLTCARQRMVRGDIQINRVSRFVHEIPRDLVDLGHSIEKKKSVLTDDTAAGGGSAYAQMRRAFRAKPYQEPVHEKRNFGSTEKEALSYTVGDTVSHARFGTGIVKNIVSGGRDYEVTVEFEKAGVRKMFAQFAKLRKI